MVLLFVFVLSILLVGALGFITLSFRYDLTSKAVLYKILARFGKARECFRPAETYAPYRRLRNVSNGAHRPLLLNLETSEGSGQACHPDVAYIPEGFGEKKWTYWMACTPYPYKNAYFENPELFVSHDGINWAVPPGLTNPLVPSLKTLGDHNSDPDILFHKGELWLFYRETVRSKIPNENKICLMKSADGVRWSVPLEVLSENNGSELLSPTVVYDGSQFLMWTVEILNGEFKIMRRYSQDGVKWGAPLRGSMTGLHAPRHVWHIDVIQDYERLSAVLVSCVGLGGSESRIHYAYSEDQGLSWSTDGFMFERTYEFEADVQYRGCLGKREEQPWAYDLWYSAGSTRRMFSIAYVRLNRERNRLLPWQMSAERSRATK